jgi:hypothetical protein
MGLATSTQPAHGTVIQRARLLTESGQARTLDNAPPIARLPLGRQVALGQATPKERTDSQISAPSPVVEAVPLISRRLRVDAASGETPKAAPSDRRKPDHSLS